MFSPVCKSHRLQNMFQLFLIIAHVFSIQQKRKHDIFFNIQVGYEIIKLEYKSDALPSQAAHFLILKTGNIRSIYIN